MRGDNNIMIFQQTQIKEKYKKYMIDGDRIDLQ